jgi:hypothetical protein
VLGRVSDDSNALMAAIAESGSSRMFSGKLDLVAKLFVH